MATRKNGCVEFNDDVKFKTEVSEYDNCVCNGCHTLNRVYKLTYPNTLYHDGRTLTTRYYSYWLCGDCVEKLLKAIADAAGRERAKQTACEAFRVLERYWFCADGEREDEE